MSTIQQLRDVLSSSDKWTKGSNARDNAQQKVSYDYPKACSFCLRGAILKVSPSQIEEDSLVFDISNKIYEINNRLPFSSWADGPMGMGARNDDIVAWNDAEERTFADIQRVLGVAV